MLIVSDVHGAAEPLRRVASLGEPLLVLGDLINYIDYRTNDGIVAEISGRELVDEFVRLRASEGSDAASEGRAATDGKRSDRALRSGHDDRGVLATPPSRSRPGSCRILPNLDGVVKSLRLLRYGVWPDA